MQVISLLTSLTFLTFSLIPPQIAAGFQPVVALSESMPFSTLLSGVSYGQILAVDPSGITVAAGSDAAPGHAYFVQVLSQSTWTPPLPEDVTTTFVYDGDGGRVEQITPAGTTRFLGASVELRPDASVMKYFFAGSQRMKPGGVTTRARLSKLHYDNATTATPAPRPRLLSPDRPRQ